MPSAAKPAPKAVVTKLAESFKSTEVRDALPAMAARVAAGHPFDILINGVAVAYMTLEELQNTANMLEMSAEEVRKAWRGVVMNTETMNLSVAIRTKDMDQSVYLRRKPSHRDPINARLRQQRKSLRPPKDDTYMDFVVRCALIKGYLEELKTILLEDAKASRKRSEEKIGFIVGLTKPSFVFLGREHDPLNIPEYLRNFKTIDDFRVDPDE